MSCTTRATRAVVFAACCLSLVFGACGSDTPAPAADGGSGGGPTLVVENPGSGGRPAAIGGAGSSAPHTAGASASAGSAGLPASAGTSAAGAGGAAAGSGGTISAGAGGAGSAAGAGDDDDVFGGLLPTPQLSCDGLVCFEDADCASLYPDEDAACHFTHCEDLVCK